MDGVDQEILEELGPWLRGRSRRLANKLGRLEDAADIEHEAIAIFYANAARWLQQPAKLSRTAQLRTLLGLCLHRVAKEWVTRLAREQLSHGPEGGGGAPGEADRHGEPARWSGGEAEAVHTIDTRRRFERVYTAIVERLVPPRCLYVLAIHSPHLLECAQVQKASTYRAGGATPVRRSVDEAWALFREQREDADLVNDASRWKRTVAEIFQLTGPLGSHAEVDLHRAVNYIDQQISRATHQLSEEMAQGQRP